MGIKIFTDIFLDQLIYNQTFKPDNCQGIYLNIDC